MALFLFEDDNFWNEKKKLVKVPFSIEKQFRKLFYIDYLLLLSGTVQDSLQVPCHRQVQ